MTCAADGMCLALAQELDRKEMLLKQTVAKCEQLRARALEAERLVPRRQLEKSFRDLQLEVHVNAVNHGWWESIDPSVSEIVTDPTEITVKLALVTTEVAEAIEDIRNGDMSGGTTPGGKPIGFPAELADIVIRCLDLAGAMGIDLQHEIERKHEYNKSREYRHGGKVL